MKLNKAEKLMMNNVIQALLVRWFYKGVGMIAIARRRPPCA